MIPAWIVWIMFSLIVIFLFVAPYKYGLFHAGPSAVHFEKNIYYFLVWGSILFFLFSIYLLKYWKLHDHRDLLSIFIWFLPLSYLISIIPAASYNLSTKTLYLYVIYSILFLFGLYLVKNDTVSKLLQAIILISGFSVVIFGFMNVFGNYYFYDAVNVITHTSELRLSSVFQYPNTYAAFLMALLFCCLFKVVSSKKWDVGVYAFFLIPIIISFILTFSRGGFVLLPILFIFFMVFLSFHRQILLLLYCGLSLIPSMWAFTRLREIGLHLTYQHSPSLMIKGWAILIITSLIFAAIIYFSQRYVSPVLEKYVQRLDSKKWINVILPILFFIVMIISLYLVFNQPKEFIILPEFLQGRIDSISLEDHSVLERITFNKDSLDMLKDHLLIGAGGGGWRALSDTYQSNPYSSKESHNFFTQYAVESGLVGLVIFLIFLVTIYYRYIKYYVQSNTFYRDRDFVFFIITITLLTHSLIDLNMSFAYLLGLVFLSFGALMSNIHAPIGKWLQNSTIKARLRFIYPLLLLSVSIIILVTSFQFLKSNAYYLQYQSISHQHIPFDEMIIPLDAALDIRPTHPEYAAEKIELLYQAYQNTEDHSYLEQANDLIQKVKQKEPYDLDIFFAEYQFHLLKEQPEKAIDVIVSGIKLTPWNYIMYERAIDLYFELGDQARLDSDMKLKREYWEQAINTLELMKSKRAELEALPDGLPLKRQFDVTDNMIFAVAKIHYLSKDYSNATNTLRPFVTVNSHPELIRWYLASLLKQNENDQEMYDQFIQLYPDEEQEINELLDF